MTDRYRDLVNSAWGQAAARRLGLPRPEPLRRHVPGRPLLTGDAVVGAAPGGRLAQPVRAVLDAAGATTRSPDEVGGAPSGGRAGAGPDGDAHVGAPLGALVYDASGIRTSEDLHHLYAFGRALVARLGPCGRVLVLGTPPELCDDPREAVAQQALDGFVRSLAKEVGRGATAQLLRVDPGAEAYLGSTLRFLLSARSAYVSGQTVRVGAPADGDTEDDLPEDGLPLDGRVAVVTGAARGIGAAIAGTLARDGAHVVCVDVPAAGDALTATANRVGGETLTLDVTTARAGDRLVEHLRSRHGGVDVVVHNAGVTRDRTLARMKPDRWDSVLAVNLTAQERLTGALLDADVLRPRGRLVCVASMSGIAGNRGQTNYAASKAGVIGLVRALAPRVARRAATANAVAPGFIETEMTAAMPKVTREVARRLASLAQGGLPVDVAEPVAWLARPGSGGVNGQVVRVCGQNIVGA
jgi:3-oxoacyl-[acyl-carrier protein] reductase